MTKHLQIKDATYERLNNGKFNNSFSEVIDKLINDKETLHRENALLRQEISILRMKQEVIL